MSRDDRQRLDDIAASCAAIHEHLVRGTLDDGLVFDAVRMRLVEIGEAAKTVSPDLLATEPEIPWRQVIGMRDRLAHRYFDTLHAIVEQTATADLAELSAAIDRMIGRIK